MWRYQLEDYDYRVIGEQKIQLYDKKRFVAEINFRLDGNELWITNLYRTEYGKTLKTPGRYYGTEIFAILLLYLFKHEISFASIVGRLSVSDAENNNWLASIPYYARFEQFVPERVGYRLKFYLYDDKEALYERNNIELPDYKEKESFRRFVDDFQREHVMQRKDAYFRYTVEK